MGTVEGTKHHLKHVGLSRALVPFRKRAHKIKPSESGQKEVMLKVQAVGGTVTR